MPRGSSPKREQEYKELKSEFKKEGRYPGREEEVASRIVNKQRAQHGETKDSPRKKEKCPNPEKSDPLSRSQTRERNHASDPFGKFLRERVCGGAFLHPHRTLRYSGEVSLPITLRRPAKSIIKHITGAAVTPLIIAAHTSALMGSTFVKFRASPISVATATPSKMLSLLSPCAQALPASAALRPRHTQRIPGPARQASRYPLPQD
jgi:hypothetical protein